jgi:hypothetical protein
MDISKKLAHAAEKFNPSPRKKSFVSLDHRSSSGTEESEPATEFYTNHNGGDSKRDRKVSSSSTGSSPKNAKKSKKKRSVPTIEEELANTGYEVTPKMLVVANISKKHALRNELLMLNYVNTLSEKLCAQEYEIQLLHIQLKQIQEAQRQRDLYEATQKRRLEDDDDRLRQSSIMTRLFSPDDDCTIF